MRANGVRHLFENFADDAAVESLLGAEVVVDHRLRGLRVLGNFAKGSCGEAFLRKVAKGTGEDAVAHLSARGRASKRGGTHRDSAWDHRVASRSAMATLPV